jgi:hypothetical protein
MKGQMLSDHVQGDHDTAGQAFHLKPARDLGS